MRMRSLLLLVAVGCISYSTLSVMVSSLKPLVEDYSKETSFKLTKRHRKKRDKKTFYKHHSEQLQHLLADDSTRIEWNHVRDDFDLHRMAPNNSTTQYVETRNLCGVARAFQRYRDSVLFAPSPHVLWWKSPTDSDDPIQHWQEEGCTVADLMDYMNHNDTLAVMVTRNSTGVVALNHPKLFPMTPGLWQDKSPAQRDLLWDEIVGQLPVPNRTLPLLILGDRTETTRTMQVKDRLARGPLFPSIKAVYHPKDQDPALLYENFLKAKFVVGIFPGGSVDWVTEAMALGAIPILEDEKNNNYRLLFEDLPVVWIDDYDNLSPELSELEYAAVLHDAPSFRYERLTQGYWIDRALRILEELEEEQKRDKEEMAKLMAKRNKEEKRKKRVFRFPKD